MDTNIEAGDTPSADGAEPRCHNGVDGSAMARAGDAQRVLHRWVKSEFPAFDSSLRHQAPVSWRERRWLAESVGLTAIAPGGAYQRDDPFVVVVVFRRDTPLRMADLLPPHVDGVPVVAEFAVAPHDAPRQPAFPEGPHSR